MATSTTEQNADDPSIRSLDSFQFANNPDESSSSELREPRRSTSVRFSEHINTASQSSMTGRRGGSNADEITPIRTAGGNTDRIYHTSGRSSSAASSINESTGVSQASKPPSAPHEAENSTGKQEESWYKRIASKYGSVMLDNKGSVARDHLALERTFLAWLRTSLAFASIGIAVTQLFRLNTSLATKDMAVQMENNLPFAPLLGHSVPIELLPYLQHIASGSISTIQIPTLGPTLLDQLLLLPPPGLPIMNDGNHPIQIEQSSNRIKHLGKPLGATFIGISIVVLLVGFHRYFESQYWIIRGKFPASRGSIALVGLIAGALIVASLVVVVVIDPTQVAKK